MNDSPHPDPLTRDEAIAFFSDFFGGEHHIPAGKYRGARGVKEWGTGWCVTTWGGELSTFDFDGLTRLVLMAHDQCIRVEVAPAMRYLRIAIWRRLREGRMSARHPTIEQAIEAFRSHR
jgi:hypothetical protein